MSFSRAAMLFLGLTPAQTRAKDQRPLDSIFCSHAPNRLGRHAPAPPFLFKLSQGGAGALVLNRRTALLLVLWPDRPPCPGAPGNGSLFRSERSLNNSPGMAARRRLAAMRARLQPPQLPLHNRPYLRRHQIPERIRRIIAPDAILVSVHLQNVLRPVWIMLQRRQCLHQPPAPLVNE